jgi:hypothetical protein
MRYIRHIRSNLLPEPEFTGHEHKDDKRVAEFDQAFDQVATALSDLYLVDPKGGCGVEGAPISMSRYVDICRQHTIVVGRQAWHSDIVRILHEQLQSMPDGWTLAIDVDGSHSGQAQIVVEADGTIHGWSDYSAHSVLENFGFPPLCGFVTKVRFAAVSILENLKRRRTIRKALSQPFSIEDHIHPYSNQIGEQAGRGDGDKPSN